MSNFFSRIAHWLNKHRAVFALGFAALTLLLAQSAFWINQTLFDKQTFTDITTGVIQSEQSREALASSIVDRALEDRPVLRRTISDKATQLLTGLFGTDAITQAIDLIIDKAYTYVTSDSPEPIAFDLTAIKTPVARIVALAEDQGREVAFDPNTIPDEIVLFDPGDLPDVYRYSVMMLWLGPLFWISTILLFGIYIYRGGKQFYAKRVYIVGGVVALISCLGMLAGPVLPPPITAMVPHTELRGIVGDLLHAFLQPFMQQMLVTLFLTAITLLIFSQRLTLLRLAQKLQPNKPGTAAETVPTATKSFKNKPKAKSTKKR